MKNTQNVERVERVEPFSSFYTYFPLYSLPPKVVIKRPKTLNTLNALNAKEARMTAALGYEKQKTTKIFNGEYLTAIYIYGLRLNIMPVMPVMPALSLQPLYKGQSETTSISSISSIILEKVTIFDTYLPCVVCKGTPCAENSNKIFCKLHYPEEVS
jgi:hypothetical protein